ncbi:MAG TPA: indole-3-glycerol phosphate synthase TrpC [Oscillospiraceae bacterium]|nr:indole-3-glycerol phosphate synthase TrpC [Oscillospiraceae bacterium]
MILDEIIVKRKEQLDREKERISHEKIKELAYKTAYTPLDFKKALKKDKLSVIAEVKKASPSKGTIREDFNPVEIAVQYEKSGADAVSCLTEEYYFKGSSSYLKEIRNHMHIPILRKDFIFDEYQIYEARVIGADAILLIAAVLDTDTLVKFKKIADDLRLNCLFEVHNEEELKSVISAGAEIIGINNRNLHTFEVSLDVTRTLSAKIPDGTVIVSESGIKSNSDMKAVKGHGADAVLIGETLMKSGSIENEMKSLREGV